MEISNCPFCGDEAIHVHSNTVPDYHKVGCDECSVFIIDQYLHVAVKRWNRRHVTDRCADGCRIRKAVQEFAASLTDEY